MTSGKGLSVDPDIKAIVDQAVEESDTSYSFLHRFLDIDVRLEGETGILTFPVRKHILNRHGCIHGGIIGLAFDMAMGSLHRLAIGPALTLEMKMQYLRAISSGLVTCKSNFLKRGRTISFIESKMTSDKGEVIAAATATFVPAAR